jgi:UDP-3-O-[3-hydroxymyristoyl] glucosamine N-acyltransferase
MNIHELALKIGALQVEGASGTEEVTHTTAIEDGDPGALCFIGNPNYERYITSTKATAVIVSEHFQMPEFNGVKQPVLIRTKSPYEAFGLALEIFSPKRTQLDKGIHGDAAVHSGATVAKTARIGAHATISDGVTIGDNTEIYPGVFIGPNTTIGSDCVIHPNAVIYDGVTIGDRVVVGACTVVGFDGFGYVPMANGFYKKIPQVGTVVIEDDVEIGACCTIDRATIAETRIKRGVRLDNLIQIAHNVELGENTVMAAQSGVAGSTKVGRQNIIAGQVGLTGHIETTANVIIGAQSGVSKSITKPGTYFGYPAKGHREALKLEGALRSLPELIERVKQLEEELKKERA